MRRPPVPTVALLLLALLRPVVALFEIYWNVPSEQCRKAVNPEKYNFTTNSGQIFRGDKIVIFYEKDLGFYPFCAPNEDNSTGPACKRPIHGGVPQAVNLTAHIEKVRKDVATIIADPDFNGLAVIDFESWRPLFDLNWESRKVYQEYSIDLLRPKYPDLPRNSLVFLARYLFEYHAKQFLLATINTARSVRPKAKWGFWDYPLCDYKLGVGEMQCRGHYKIINEQLLWMFNASDIILPPIYFYRPDSTISRQQYVHAKIVEAEWINRKLHPKRLAVYAYAKFEYNVTFNASRGQPDRHFYTKADVCNSLKFPMELGVDGVVLWSTSNFIKQRCAAIAAYLESVLGPFGAAVRKRAEKCAWRECGGRGVCAALERAPGAKCELAHSVEAVRCECAPGFAGDRCQFRTADCSADA